MSITSVERREKIHMERRAAIRQPTLLEHEIEQTIRGHRHELPDQEAIPPIEPDIGRLSAEAVLAQYEQAAKSVEEMGTAVKDRIGKLEAALKECDADLKLIGEAASVIREKGKLVFAQIEEAAALSKDIRDSCADFTRKAG